MNPSTEEHTIGAESTFRGKIFLPENICKKINEMPKFYMIFGPKCLNFS